MASPKEIINLAVKMSWKYYGKPLVVVHGNDRKSDRLVSFIMDNLRPSDYEFANEQSMVYQIVDGAVAHRLSVVASGEKDFAVKGQGKDEGYSFFHVDKIENNDLNKEYWDNLLLIAMKNQMNTVVNPFAETNDYLG